jgi:hypothetical protein
MQTLRTVVEWLRQPGVMVAVILVVIFGVPALLAALSLFEEDGSGR